MRPSSELLFSICFHVMGPTHSLVNLFKFYPTTTVGHADVLPPGLVLSRVTGLPTGNKFWIGATCPESAGMAWALVATVLLLPGCHQNTLLGVPLAVISPQSPAKLVHSCMARSLMPYSKRAELSVWCGKGIDKTKADCLADVLAGCSWAEMKS